MSAIDFPNTPTLNQLFSVGNRTWQWTGQTWSTVEQVVVGPTGPASTVQGPTGPTGPAGGPTGPTGPIGATGANSTVQGPTGPTGPASVVAAASTTVSGIVQLSTSAQTLTGTDANRVVTPASLADFLPGTTGIGVGKSFTSGRGSLDAQGQMFQNNGQRVLDTGNNLGSSKIINGALQINQRGVVSGVVLRPGEYGFDRWRASGWQNLILNPSAEVGIAPWASPNVSFNRVSTWSFSGSSSFQLSTPATEDGAMQTVIPTVPGRTYTASGVGRLTAPLAGAGMPLRARAVWIHDAPTATDLGQSSPIPNVAGQARVSVTFVARGPETLIRYYHGHSAGTIWWDGLMVTEGSVLLPYIDGSTGGTASWQGTAHNSISQSQISTTLTFTPAPQGQLVTISNGGGLVQIIENSNIVPQASVFSWEGTAIGRTFAHTEAAYAAIPSITSSPINVTPQGIAHQVVEVLASGGNRTFGLAQFDLGNVEVPFKRIMFAEELQACQRYFVRLSCLVPETPFGVGMQTTLTTSIVMIPLPVPMRAVPSVPLAGCNVSDRSSFTTPVTAITVVRGGAPGTASVGLDINHASTGAFHRPVVINLQSPGVSTATFDAEML